MKITRIPYIVLPLMLLALSFLGTCNTNPARATLETAHNINGTIVINESYKTTDSVFVAIDFSRYGDSIPTNAALYLDGKQLVFNKSDFPVDSVFSIKDTALASYFGKNLTLILQDSTTYLDTLIESAADTFTILTIEPPNRLLPGGGPVSLTWSASANTDGYIMAAVLRDDAYQGEGYSAYPITTESGGTIPTEAFTDGTNTVFGWYYIYVYAFSGVPDSVLTHNLLPVPLPDQLTDNIDERVLRGHFGTVFVTAYDSVQVTSLK